jgi:hypothetical protein
MRFNAYLMCFILGVAALTSGCATMQIQTNRPDAIIYLDGREVGIGQAKVSAMGLPKTSVLRAEADGEVVTQSVSREFTLVTALLMPITYATSALWGWQYPNSTVIRFTEKPAEGWDGHGDDLWGQPLHATAKVMRSPAASSEKLKPAGADPWAQPLTAD